VLSILKCSEVEARAFVIGVATGAAIPVDALEPADAATRLAVRLRALALILCVVLAQARSAPRIAIDSRAGQDRPAGRADRNEAPPAFDTS
jgi:hypothetical protein